MVSPASHIDSHMFLLSRRGMLGTTIGDGPFFSYFLYLHGIICQAIGTALVPYLPGSLRTRAAEVFHYLAGAVSTLVMIPASEFHRYDRLSARSSQANALMG